MGSTIESHYPSILETIRARTIEHPDATAICTSDGGLTYAELDRTSNQLAHHLRGLGVGPDVFVPMLFEHCQWVVITQLAILKVGGAYVPLEPSNPDTRLADIITSTNCGFLLSSEANADRATLLSEKTFCIGSHLVSELRNKNGDGAEFLSAANPNTPAYVLFTSGSTGRPKGCVVEHRALAMIPEQARLELM